MGQEAFRVVVAYVVTVISAAIVAAAYLIIKGL